MAVPGHDERDFDFAQAFDIPIRRVLVMDEGADAEASLDSAETEYGWMVNSPLEGFDGLYGEEAMKAVTDALELKGLGKQTINWKIRPWLISRQRYWGTPIPMIHCNDCGVVAVPEHDLPVVLPTDVAFGQGNPLETSEQFLKVDCPECGKAARRETDTMDTFVDSSWYFLRYIDALNDEKCFDADVVNHFMNVDFYCGGIEHAQMHLIYARFYTKALRDLGLHSVDEPFNKLLCQGMVNAPAPWCDSCQLTLSVSHAGSPCPHCHGDLSTRSAKMSKSLGNTVSPGLMIEQYGADTVRLFILFAANPTAGMEWSDTGIASNHRVMIQMASMPDKLLHWRQIPTAMDTWMLARLKQRCSEFQHAMDALDLRRAVEISHYDLIKDINWYTRRGGENAELGHRILKSWTHLVSVSTPHLAEEWWHEIDMDGLVSGTEFEHLPELLEEERSALDNETVLRSVLDAARRIKDVAERHLDGPAQSATIVVAPTWKRTMAVEALDFIEAGGSVKNFITQVSQMDIAQGERKGEIIGYWGKKMLPQVFKWDDASRALLRSPLDEVEALTLGASFIAEQLGLQSVQVVLGESEDDTTGRAGGSMPLAPAIVYA